MGITFKPVFNRLKIKNKSGLYSIHIRVTIDRKAEYINPKLPKIQEKYWSGKQNKWVKESHPNSYEVNSLLQRKLAELDNFIVRTRINERAVTFSSIKDFYFKQGDGTIFNDFAQDYADNTKGFALNTIKVYKTFLKHLNGFNPKIKFAELNEPLLNSFKSYLENEQGLNGGTTKKYFDKFKVICKEAVKKGYLEVNQNPFYISDLRIKVNKPKRTYLELDEIRAIRNLKLSGQVLEMHRDHFMFQIYSGLYYKDLKDLRKSDLNKNELGLYIMGNRIKNSNAFIIPIYKFPNAERIIEKYWEEESDWVFPKTVSDQKFNDHLKTLAIKAKINKNITNKVARHTNVQIWIGMGVERQFVSKMVGHTEETTTQEYYDVSIHNINSKVANINFEDVGI